MRLTVHLPIALGLLLLAYAMLGVGAGIMVEGLDHRIYDAANRTSQRMSHDDIVRVFDMPTTVADRERWLDSYFLKGYSRAVRRHVIGTNIAAGTLGLSLCLWGLLDRVCRRNTGSSPAVP